MAHLWAHPSSTYHKLVSAVYATCAANAKKAFFLAVLGLHAIKEKAVAIEGKVEIRPVGPSFIL